MAITPLPAPPQRTDPANFSSKADAFLGALPAFGTEANALAVETSGYKDAAAASATAANLSSESAEATANFKGVWSTLAGALTFPSSVYHSSQYWQLTEDITDVTAEVPGVSAKWISSQSGDLFLKVDSIADLRAITYTPTDGQVIKVLYHTNEANGGGGAFRWDASDSTSVDNNAYIIKAGLISAGRFKRVDSLNLTTAMWGAITGASDSTVALQASLDWAVSSSLNHLEYIGNYTVSQLTIENSGSGISIDFKGTLNGNAVASTASILELKNCVDVVLTGRLVIVANYNSNYESGVQVWGEATEGGTSFVDIKASVYVFGALVAWRIGDPSEVDTRVSEISIFGGYTRGCPTVVECYGTQTVVNFIGSNLTAGSLGGDAAWQALTQYGIRCFGGRVQVTGGELLHAQTTTGVTIQLLPITSISYDNQYGSIACTNVVIESASALLTTTQNGVASPVLGEALFIGCAGTHTQNLVAFIATDSLFEGNIKVRACAFKSTAVRTIETINAGSDNCIVDIDNYSFGEDFVQGLGAIVGGTALFDHRVIYKGATSGQSFTQSVSTVVKYTSADNTEDTIRFGGYYDNATGIFTVPPGGLKSVSIYASLGTDAPTQQSDFALYVNSSFYAPLLATYFGGSASGGVLVGQCMIGDLGAGNTIEVRFTQYGTASIENAGVRARFLISARR